MNSEEFNPQVVCYILSMRQMTHGTAAHGHAETTRNQTPRCSVRAAQQFSGTTQIHSIDYGHFFTTEI